MLTSKLGQSYRWIWLGLPLLGLVGCGLTVTDQQPRQAVTMVQFIEPKLQHLSRMTSPLLFDVAADFSAGVAMVRTGGTVGYIDHSGSLVVSVVDQNVSVATDFAEDLAVARVGDYYGYIDRTGNWAIEVQFRQAKPFAEGLAVVQRGNQYGFIDRTGNWVIEPRFDLADSFSDGLAVVKAGGLYGYVDPTGKLAIPAR